MAWSSQCCDRALWCTQPLPPQVKFWVPSSPIDFSDFLGNHSHNAHHNLLALSWWEVGMLKAHPPFPWAVKSKSGQHVPSFSSSGSGLAWTTTETQCVLHCIEQPVQLAALHLFWGFFSDFETPRSKECALKSAHFGSTAPKKWKKLELLLFWNCHDSVTSTDFFLTSSSCSD